MARGMLKNTETRSNNDNEAHLSYRHITATQLTTDKPVRSIQATRVTWKRPVKCFCTPGLAA
jgi:hypothetical protein